MKKFIKNMFNGKKNIKSINDVQNFEDDFQNFADEEIKKTENELLKKTTEKISSHLFDILSGELSYESDFFNFLSNRNFTIKSFDNFSKYILSKKKEKSTKLEDLDINIKYFNNTVINHIEKSCDDFFSYRDNIKSREYTLKNIDFLDFLKKNNSRIFDAIDMDTINKVYHKKLQEYFKKHNKNAFGLEFNFIDKQLDLLLQKKHIGDGSFLYMWNDGKTNGIDKYIVESQIHPYSSIKRNEHIVLKYILKEMIKLSYDISKSKNIVELGSGGVEKLYESILHLYGSEDNVGSFIENKKITLMDITPDGYTQLIPKFNKIKENVAEGLQGDIKNKDSNVYNLEDVTYFMLGGTIGNFSINEIENILKSMESKHRLKNNRLVLSYFEAPDKTLLTEEEYSKKIDYLKAAYGDFDKKNEFREKKTHDAFSDSILSGLEALGLPRDKLKYIVDYQESIKVNKEPAKILLGAEATEDFIQTTPSGKKISVKKGQKIRAIQSYRFTRNEFLAIAKKSGFDLVISKSSQGHRVSQKSNDPNRKSIDLACTVLKSQTGLRNNNYKKQRNWAIALTTVALLSGGGLYTKDIVKTQKIQEKIQEHKKKIEQQTTLRKVENDSKIYSLSQNLTKTFIEIYGKGDFKEEDISNEIRLYLTDFIEGGGWFNSINNNPDDLFIKDEFLQSFIKDYFYEKMFKNGFETLEPKPFLKGQEKDFIETLKYKGPIKEGYNEEDGLWYIIHAPIQKYKINDSFDSKDIFLVEGCLVAHKYKIQTISMPEYTVNHFLMAKNNQVNSELNFKLISKSEPDAEGNVTIKFNEIGEAIGSNGTGLSIIKNEKKVIFRKTEERTNVGEHTNLILDKSLITDYFEKNNPIFKKIWELFKKSSGCERYYIGKEYFPSEFHKLKENMLIDLYEDSGLGGNKISNIGSSDKMIIDYVGAFIQKNKDNIEKIKNTY